ncbi:site-specific integrase [Magnetovibrio sp. PR-2]|uniref:site-specific integrase n=1 Tax=Magnetovibrio sp. PR-2 TaxID=3120356 RepID=UPI002FCE6511
MATSKQNGKKKREKLPKGISRLPSGSYRVQISHKGDDPIRKTFEFIGRDTKENRDHVIAKAEAWAIQTRQALKDGTFTVAGPADTITVHMALDRYLHDVVSAKTSATSRKNDTNRIQSMNKEPWADKKLLELKQADIVAFREALKLRGWERSTKHAVKRLEKALETADATKRLDIKSRLNDIKKLPKMKEQLKTTKDHRSRDDILSQINTIAGREKISEAAPTTVKNKMTLLSSALKYAGEGVEGFVNPVPGTTMPPSRPGRERRLQITEDNDEQKLLLGAAKESSLPHLEPLIRMAIFTALRQGRLLDLKWSYIQDITVGGNAHQIISIPRSLQSRTKRAGTIPVFPEIAQILSELKELSPGPYLFPISTDQVEHHFRVAREKAQIENFTFHDLRHEATSRLFERGLDAVQVMSITGHTTNEMLDRYTHYPAVKVLARIKDTEGMADDIDVIKTEFVSLVYRAFSAGIPYEELLDLFPRGYST